jgi:hypothetical protein
MARLYRNNTPTTTTTGGGEPYRIQPAPASKATCGGLVSSMHATGRVVPVRTPVGRKVHAHYILANQRGGSRYTLRLNTFPVACRRKIYQPFSKQFDEWRRSVARGVSCSRCFDRRRCCCCGLDCFDISKCVDSDFSCICHEERVGK